MLSEMPFTGFIPVHDLDTARAFYTDVLGLAAVEETPFALVLDAHGTMVRVTPVGDFRAQPFTIAGWGVPDISATATALAERGVQFNRYDGLDQDETGIWTAPGGDRVAWFQDPDGNTLSLTTSA